MKYPTLLALAGLALAAAGPTLAQADTAVLHPTADFRILTYDPYGHETGYLAVYNVGDNIQHSILQFDLSALSSAATIESATLTLTATGWSQVDSRTDVYAVAHPWDNTASWMMAAAGVPWTTPGGDVTGEVFATNADVVPSAGGVPFHWDVTNLIADWHSGSLPNYGLLLAATYNDQLHFYPSVSGHAIPELSITYSAPEPASLALLALGSLAVLARRR